MFFARIVVGFLASTCIAQRDFVRAEAVLASALDSSTAMETRGQRLAWSARAELALAGDDPDLALQIVDRLIASAANVERYGQGCVPRLWDLRGAALAALGRTDEAETALLAADQGAAGMRTPIRRRWASTPTSTLSSSPWRTAAPC
jgi:hypothetical protein